MTQALNIINIAYYKFVRIACPASLQDTLSSLCEKLALKGTIILAHEGINSCLAGSEASVTAFIAHMHADPRFADIDFKRSESDTQPFRRMIVKLKSEIISMGQPGIDPANFTGKYVEPMELKQWLDNGEKVLLVDTRNDYEVALGTFAGAINPDIKTFRTFPEWVTEALGDKKAERIVTFCTGGIRCEKATAYMRQQGFEDVYQLKGGILKYFEDTSSAGAQATVQIQSDSHYNGDCFVFDHRVAVDQSLKQTAHELCFACWATLSPADKYNPLYIPEKQCPNCASEQAQKDAAHQQNILEKRQKALERRFKRSQEVRQAYLTQSQY